MDHATNWFSETTLHRAIQPGMFSLIFTLLFLTERSKSANCTGIPTTPEHDWYPKKQIKITKITQAVSEIFSVFNKTLSRGVVISKRFPYCPEVVFLAFGKGVQHWPRAGNSSNAKANGMLHPGQTVSMGEPGHHLRLHKH